MSEAVAQSPGSESLRDLPDSIVLYDGVCGLCAWAVRWLIAHDPDAVLSFAPLQGETAGRLGIEWDDDAPPSQTTVMYVDTTVEPVRIETRSRAAFAALEAAGAYRWLTRVARVVPRPIADVVYRGVAAIRYRVFGKHDQCQIPSPEERQRFLP